MWLSLAFFLLSSAAALGGTLSGTYTDPRYFLSIPFGSRSHWLQPWRAYLETVPATTFINGAGINLNLNGQDPDLVVRMLAKNGITHARIEIGWGSVNFDDESKLNNAAGMKRRIEACGRYHVRPVFLLNAHHGAPCPMRVSQHKTAANAHAGESKLLLEDVSGLKVNYSGLSNLATGWAAAEPLFTAIEGNTVTLSKPLPKDLPAGASLRVVTLKYRPFSVPGSAEYTATITGWQRYAATIATFASEVLGSAGAADPGFDMEVWNELTFGSKFLSINNYYAPKFAEYAERGIHGELVKATAAYMDARPGLFRGVQVIDGFGNTTPWPACSTAPSRIAGIGKHPYRGRDQFPKDEKKGTPINALGHVDRSAFVPAYSSLFPEYYATAIQTETMVRDMGPFSGKVNGVEHGRLARAGNPCTTWMTEVNLAPDEDNKAVSPERAMAIKAKTTARYLAFFLNKGVSQIDFYAVAGGDTNLGLVSQKFLDYAKQKSAEYPRDDAAFTSAPLATVRRMIERMRDGIDAGLRETRPLRVVSISDTHDSLQFVGDGTPEHPSLYDRDVFAILPFQVNARKFVVPYYVMTRDVMKDLAPEKFTVEIKGVKGTAAKLSAYDPVKDRTVPVTVVRRGNDMIAVTVEATDYPCLLVIED